MYVARWSLHFVCITCLSSFRTQSQCPTNLKVVLNASNCLVEEADHVSERREKLKQSHSISRMKSRKLKIPREVCMPRL
eukprot:Gb_28661 [translate_table: standard]